MTPKIGFEELPKKIHEYEYNELFDVFKQLDRDQLLSHVYRKEKTSGLYKLNLSASQEELDEIWNIYFDVYRKKWAEYAIVFFVAHYIACHRYAFQRNGDDIDDLHKARYLIALIEYLNKIRPRVIRLRRGPELDEIINMVNNIFDSAYFKKPQDPELSDKECFMRAEREFCEEKEIDFLMSEFGLGNRKDAEKLYEEAKIRAWLQRESESQGTEIPKDAISDWEAVKSRYYCLKSKKRIAKICWIISPNKSKLPEHYWDLAGEVVRKLNVKKINYVGVNPHDSTISDVIKDIVEKN
jgi:hypothetical protein